MKYTLYRILSGGRLPVSDSEGEEAVSELYDAAQSDCLRHACDCDGFAEYAVVDEKGNRIKGWSMMAMLEIREEGK